MRVLRVIATILVVPIVLVVIVVLVLATTPWGNERARRVLVSVANNRLTGTISIGTLRGNLFSSATLVNVSLVDSTQRPVFTARRVRVEYALWPALRGQVVLRSLVLDTPLVVLDKQPGARWNFQAILQPSSTPKDTSRHAAPPVLANITIRHGRVLYRRPWSPDSTLSATARDSVIAAAVREDARRRVERVANGFQRVLDYHDLDAVLSSVDLAHGAQPAAVRIAALSMLGEPYRAPAIDIRSLVGTLLVSKDSLWWRGARMRLPASNVSGDGTIGFHRSGFRLDLTGAPVAVADLRWLDPKLPLEGGGALRYAMHLHGDTADFDVSDASVHFRDASLVGHAGVTRVSPKGGTPALIVRGADLTVARLSTQIIHELAPTVVLKGAGVFDGHLAVTGPPRALLVDADVRFNDAAVGVTHLLARGGIGIEHGIDARNVELTLRPLHVATLAAAGISLPLGGIVTGHATVSGSMRSGWNVRGDLVHVEHDGRSRVIGAGTFVARGKTIVADVTLAPLSLVSVNRFAPAAQLRGSVTGDLHLDGTARNIRFHGALRSLNDGGSLSARGSLALAGARSRYDLIATIDSLNAAAFSRRAPVVRATGTASVHGTGTKLASLNAVTSVDLVRSSYDTFFVDRLSARARAANGVLHVDTLDIRAFGARAVAAGSLGLTAERSGSVHFSARVDSLGTLRKLAGSNESGSVSAPRMQQRKVLVAARADSGRRADSARIERLALGLPEGVALVVDSLSAIRRDSLFGTLTATGTLDGNVKALAVDASLRGDALVARGRSVRRLDVLVSSKNIRDSLPTIHFRVAADTITSNGYALQHVQMEGDWRRHYLWAGISAQQDSLVSYAVTGGYDDHTPGVHDVRLALLRASIGTDVWQLQHPANVLVDHGAVVIDSVDLRNTGGGRVFASGVIASSGPVRLDVAAEGVHIATILQALQRDSIADGVVALHAGVHGSRVAPSIVGNATLRAASYQGIRAPDTDVGLEYQGRRLTLNANARDSTGHRVLAGTASLPVNLSLDTVSGSRREAGPLAADIVLDSLSLAALPFHSRNIDGIRGTLAGDAHMRGSWKERTYAGGAAVRGGALTLLATGMHVDGAVADLRFSGDTLHLDSLVARAGGALRAWGTVDLRDMSRPYVNVSATGQNIRVMDQLRGLVDADADIAAVGPLSELRVTGRGEMRDGFLALKQFRKDLLRVKPPGDLSFLAVFDTSAPSNDSLRRRLALAQTKRVAMIADVSLVVDRGSYYRNRPDANTEFYTGLGEELRVHIDQRTDDQWAVGFVRIGDGVAFFRTRPFAPAHGSLSFVPHTDAPGMVQQVSERLLWEPGRGWLPLQLFTGGTSKGPSIGLESGTLFPMRGRELNGYLTLGRASTSLLQQTGSSLSGSASWSGQLSGESGALAHRQQGATALGVVLHDLGTGATKEFGLDAFSVSPADVPTELVFGKTGGVRGALIEGGRYLTTDRYVGGELRFTSGIPGVRMAQRFGAAYRLDIGVEPRFLFRAPEELGITHPTVRTGVFGVFLTRLWDF